MVSLEDVTERLGISLCEFYVKKFSVNATLNCYVAMQWTCSSEMVYCMGNNKWNLFEKNNGTLNIGC